MDSKIVVLTAQLAELLQTFLLFYSLLTGYVLYVVIVLSYGSHLQLMLIAEHSFNAELFSLTSHPSFYKPLLQ